jgi:branched-chain amino acid transport system permease protein
MKPEYKTGLIYGSLAGFLSLLFGGWSIALFGLFLGVLAGLTIGGKVKRSETFMGTAAQSLSTTVPAAIIFAVFAIVEAFVISPAAGKLYVDMGVFIASTVIGTFSITLVGGAITGLHTLPADQERMWKMIILAVLIIAFPFVDEATGLRWTAQIIFALIFVILGLGLNIVVGFAGLLDLGYAAFFAIGAYTTGILSSPQHDIYLNFWLVIWIAAGMAAIWGLMLGAPTLPLRGDYLAIVTLGFGEIIPVIFKNLIDVTIKEPLTCWIIPGIQNLFGAASTVSCITFIEHMDLTAGEKGINPIGRPIVFGYEFQSNYPVTWYFLIIAIILLSIFLIRRLRDSRLGRAWMAIREDELAASQMGINPVRTKLLAFAMGATFSGFAGAFYAAYIRGIFPSVFDFSASIMILCVVVLGGLGNINGVIVGGLIIMTADRLFLPGLKDLLKGLMDYSILPALAGAPALKAAVAQNANPILYRFLLFGLTLVIMMRVRPEGLLPSAQVRAEMHKDEVAEEPVQAKG